MSRPKAAASKNWILPGVIVVVALALAVWLVYAFLIKAGPKQQAVADTTEAPVVERLTDTKQLQQAAREAVAQQRYLEPPNNNAIELYLRLLELDPQNSSAKTALLELMPYATDAADALIAGGQYDRAQRAIELLNRADPGSSIIETLANRLQRTRAQAEAQRLAQEEARKRAQEEEERRRAEALAARRAEQEAQQAAAATPAAPTPAAPAPAAPTPAAPTPVAAAPTPAAPAPATPAPTAPSPAPAARAEGDRDFELVQAVAPTYPQRALRSGIQGWVEVEFTINVDGSVSDARVVNAQPRREFDQEAIRAINRYKFKPRIQDGRPVPATGRRRIEFKLSG